MTHEEARAAYSRRLDGALEKEAGALLDSHLSACSECREYCEGLKWSVSAVEGLRGVPPVPEGLLAKVKESISSSPQARPRPIWGISVLVLASALVVFLVTRQKPVPEQASLVVVQTAAAPVENLPRHIPAVFELPAAAARDILAIERVLRGVPQAALGVVFRGAGKEDPLVAALSRAGLKELSLTDEISAILKARHKRLDKIDGLKAAGKASEGVDGLLMPSVKGISAAEKSLMDDENSDRAELLRFYAAQLAPAGKAPQAEQSIKEEFSKAINTIKPI